MPQYNGFVYNGQRWNGGAQLVTTYSTDRLVFENYSLSDGTSFILTKLVVSEPNRELVGGNVPRGHGMYRTADYYRSYAVEAEGIAKAASASALATLMNTMRKNLSKSEGNLDLTDDDGTIKRFVATLENPDELFAAQEAYHITYVPWRARFRCVTPFPQARDYTSQYLNFASSPVSQTVVNSGTFRALPVFYLIFNSATSVTAVQVANNTTGETISYTVPSGSIAANDVFIFDSDNKQVTRNGVAADYSGAFPTLATSTNNLTVTITGTAFNVDMTTLFKLTYL